MFYNKKIVRKMMNRLKVYPFIIIVCFGPAFVHRIFYLSENGDSDFGYWLNLVAGCLSALYGFLNAIVYGLTTKVKKVLKHAILDIFSKKNLSVTSNLIE
jgi:hypothetical protein